MVIVKFFLWEMITSVNSYLEGYLTCNLSFQYDNWARILLDVGLWIALDETFQFELWYIQNKSWFDSLIEM